MLLKGLLWTYQSGCRKHLAIKSIADEGGNELHLFDSSQRSRSRSSTCLESASYSLERPLSRTQKYMDIITWTYKEFLAARTRSWPM